MILSFACEQELFSRSSGAIARCIRAYPSSGSTEFSSLELNSSAVSGFAAARWCCNSRFFGSFSKASNQSSAAFVCLFFHSLCSF